jgi:hypothetical protein
MRSRVLLPAIALAMAGLFTPRASLAFSFDTSCSEPGREAVSLCLEGLLQYHCGLLSGGSPGAWFDCATSVHSGVRLLNLENLSIPEASSPDLQLHVAAFTDSLVPVFESPSTTRLLGGLLQDFEASYRLDEPRSLWDQAGKFAPERANRLRLLGVLFQSVTPVSGGNIHFHLLKLSRVARAYLLSGFDTAAAGRIQQNSALYLDFVSRLQKSKILTATNPAFSLYPPLVPVRDLDPVVHHFYVPAHLARLLLKEGNSPGSSFFAPFLFNTLYELRKIDRKLGLGRWPYSYPGAFASPALMSRVEINVRKIYTGYVGALYGAGREARAMGYPDFRRAFAADPYATLQRLMKTPL